MHQAALLVPELLPLAIPFHLPRVVLTVLPPVARMRCAPLARTLPAHLLVNRIGSDLLPVIIAAALPLAFALAANKLWGMVRGRLKELLTVTATASAHEVAPAQNQNRSFCPEKPLRLNTPAKNSAHIESPVEFCAASPPTGLLPLKPAELLLFYTGADISLGLRVPSRLVAPWASGILGRAVLSSADANGICSGRLQRQNLFYKDVMFPVVTEIINVLDSFVRLEVKVGQFDLVGAISEADAPFVSHAILSSVDDKSVQMTIHSTHDQLHGFVKCPDRRIAWNQDASPHRRLDASQDNLELINSHRHFGASNVERTDGLQRKMLVDLQTLLGFVA